jgi:hypothetical protein
MSAECITLSSDDEPEVSYLFLFGEYFTHVTYLNSHIDLTLFYFCSPTTLILLLFTLFYIISKCVILFILKMILKMCSPKE